MGETRRPAECGGQTPGLGTYRAEDSNTKRRSQTGQPGRIEDTHRQMLETGGCGDHAFASSKKIIVANRLPADPIKVDVTACGQVNAAIGRINMEPILQC